jgi:epsilon-lactone hydrolase
MTIQRLIAGGLVRLNRIVLSNTRFAISHQRFNLDHISSKFSPPLSRSRVDRITVKVGTMKVRWLVPRAERKGKVILYLHGGGYVTGSWRSHQGFVSRIAAETGRRTIIINYRRAPEHPFPAALEDAVEAYRWLLDQGYPPEGIAIAGDSAGGGLTLALLMALRDRGLPRPEAAVLISPWTDLKNTGGTLATNRRVEPMISTRLVRVSAAAYLAGQDPENSYASPLYGDFRGLPRVLVQTGSREILLDDTLRCGVRAADVGADFTVRIWKDMFHVWHFFAWFLPEGKAAIREIGEFLAGKSAT